MNRVAPELTGVHHIKLCYSKDTYCGNPRAMPDLQLRQRRNCRNPPPWHLPPIRHGKTSGTVKPGYKGRAKILLQRSLDHGQTWLHENDVVIWDDSRPLEEKRGVLWQADEPGVIREQIDLTRPGRGDLLRSSPDRSGRCPDGGPTIECFAFRSADRGQTWEDCSDAGGSTATAWICACGWSSPCKVSRRYANDSGDRRTKCR